MIFLFLFLATATPHLTFTTLAGSRGGAGAIDGVGGAARFHGPLEITTDRGGNVYVADSRNQTIRKVTPAGVVTTLAGLAGVTGTADGWGGAARLSYPRGIAADDAGNMFVADSQNSTIRKVTPGGLVTTFAGQPGGYGTVDGKGSAARFSVPWAIAADRRGNVYVASLNGDPIRKITPDGVVSTLAHLGRAIAVAVDDRGTIYVAETEKGEIEKVGANGQVTTFATGFDHPMALSTDADGNVYVADRSAIRKITPEGVVQPFSDGAAEAVVAGTDGNLYAARGDAIEKISAGGDVSIFAGASVESGSNDGRGLDARFDGPDALATDAAGNVYIADNRSYAIRKMTPDGVVSTIATKDDLSLSGPIGGLAVGRDGSIYIADAGNPRILRATSSGVETIADLGKDSRPTAIAVDDSGNVYVADSHSESVRKVSEAGITTLASGYTSISGITVDHRGHIYTTAYYSGLVETIADSRRITIAGSGDGISNDVDGIGVSAVFGLPHGLVVDRDGNLYVVEWDGVRMVTPDGVVTTLTVPVGLNGTDATFENLYGIAIDESGTLYVSDASNSIRVAHVALPDGAKIDSTTGAVGAARQLDTAPQNATSWEWRIVRQPSGSTAMLSSTSIRNPTFIPDAADVFVFQVTATDGVSTSVSTVSLSASAGRRRRAAPRSEP